MSRLTRDGTAEPVSRDQILRHARGQGNIIFPVQLTTSRIGNLTRLIHALLYVMTIHTYVHTYRCSYTYIYICILYNSSEPCTNVPGIQTNTNSNTVPVHIYVLTTDSADHEQVWQPYAVDPYYSAISKWWPYLLALYINTDHQQ